MNISQSAFWSELVKFAENPSSEQAFMDAMEATESGTPARSDGDIPEIRSRDITRNIVTGGNDTGPFQVTRGAVDDVNRVIGSRDFTHQDRLDPDTNQQLAELYTDNWLAPELRDAGIPVTAENLGGAYNAGAAGFISQYRDGAIRPDVRRHMDRVRRAHEYYGANPR